MFRILLIAILSVVGTCIAMKHVPILSHNAFSVAGNVSLSWGVILFFGIMLLVAALLRKA